MIPRVDLLLHYIAKVSTSIEARGLMGAIKVGVLYAVPPLVLLRPTRVRKRIGDWLYDRAHGVETSSFVDVARLRARSPYVSSATRYEATPAPLFRQMMIQLGLPFDQYTFLDYGSGKGKCLLMASEFPFARIIGVDFSPEVTQIARENIRRYVSRREVRTEIEIVQADAVDYDPPAGNLVCYFYNPFGAAVLQHVHDNLVRNAHSGREIILLYYNPVHRGIFDRSTRFAIVTNTAEFCVYRNV